MTDFLFFLLIQPIKLIITVVYQTFKWITHNPGLSIVCVSLVVNVLTYPLYKRSDEIQEEERRKQESMSHWNEHIRKTFSGDERVMMRAAYYKLKHYQPYYALKSSISLLLQIPFFIAAYSFLSNLAELNGVGFLMIPDLGAPDGLLRLGGLSVNILPVLMTLINVCSGALYTRGVSWRNKWQIYAIAVIFMVLLYDRPAGLVLYWTLNNLFSLIKNVIRALLQARNKDTSKATADPESGTPAQSAGSTDLGKSGGSSGSTLRRYLPGVILLTVLMGLLIPSAVIASSPPEFIEADVNTNPLIYVLYTFYVAAGMFLIWFTVFYFLATDKVRELICNLIFCLNGVFLVDYLFFGRDLGIMSSFLIYENEPYYPVSERLINTLVIAIVVAAFVLIIKKLNSMIPAIYSVGIIILLIMSVVNITKTAGVLRDNDYTRAEKTDVAKDQILTLSRSGKNVVFIMIDRAIGVYVPYIFAEKPELKEQYSGFTCYANTVSFGRYTNFGTPSLFGGYEYTPDELNKRSDESLAEKQNEADLMLPVLFSENGYKTTVCDPPYVNYHYAGDLSIFEDYPDIDAYITRNPNAQPHQQSREIYRKNVFFMYSVFKVAPVLIQPRLYTDGFYCLFLNRNDTEDFFKASFEESYYELSNLSQMTTIMDSDQNTYFSMVNNMTHDPIELQLPDYEPVANVNNTGLETNERTNDEGEIYRLSEGKNYHVNMMAFMLIGRWLDYLKEEGVYDNTRIIIASDHGRNYDNPEEYVLDENCSLMEVIPVFFYKDFDAHEEYCTSDEFMTLADAPTLLTRDIIENPVNPFTGKTIDDSEKTAHDQLIIMSDNWDVLTNNGNTYDESDWYSVHDNVYDLDNWESYDYPIGLN